MLLSHTFVFKILFISFGCAGSSCCTRSFSSCSKQGLLSGCSAWASHCAGFSCCRAWTLGHKGFSNWGTCPGDFCHGCCKYHVTCCLYSCLKRMPFQSEIFSNKYEFFFSCSSVWTQGKFCENLCYHRGKVFGDIFTPLHSWSIIRRIKYLN